MRRRPREPGLGPGERLGVERGRSRAGGRGRSCSCPRGVFTEPEPGRQSKEKQKQASKQARAQPGRQAEAAGLVPSPFPGEAKQASGRPGPRRSGAMETRRRAQLLRGSRSPLLVLLAVAAAGLGFGSAAEVATSTASPALTVKTAAAESTDQVFEPANSLPSRSESAAVQPVVGIGQRVKMRPNEKKDLGTLGYVLGLIMVVIIILIGAGIVVGYVYKRGKDLKEQHEQKVYEREMQRITLPLSAFTNPACELVDENMIVVHSNQTPVEDVHEGDAPLMAQAGTPGA